MGRAAPGVDVTIVDEDGRELPPGKTGQIALHVKPQRPLPLFAEYWKNPEETAAKHVGDFYLTGDTGYCDKDGYFFFGGRADDVINSASYRIGPSEVESALLEHPSVLESAAIGVPEELRGEIVQAYIVLRPGFEPSEHLKRRVAGPLQTRHGAYKYPRQIVFVPELPKTVSGKIRRVELRPRSRRGQIQPRTCPSPPQGTALCRTDPSPLGHPLLSRFLSHWQNSPSPPAYFAHIHRLFRRHETRFSSPMTTAAQAFSLHTFPSISRRMMAPFRRKGTPGGLLKLSD